MLVNACMTDIHLQRRHVKIYFSLFQSIIYKAGFRSLGEGEVVEFESKPSDKGIEATFVCGVGGAECRGSDRRPMSRKKFRKIR